MNVTLWGADLPFFLGRNEQCICHDDFQLFSARHRKKRQWNSENKVKLMTTLVFFPSFSSTGSFGRLLLHLSGLKGGTGNLESLQWEKQRQEQRKELQGVSVFVSNNTWVLIYTCIEKLLRPKPEWPQGVEVYYLEFPCSHQSSNPTIDCIQKGSGKKWT